jgi:hypothetical protein
VFAELEADGLITRDRNERDGRGAVLTVTAGDTSALEADMRERDQWLAAALAVLSETELGLLRPTGPLLDRLADRTDIPDRPRRSGAGTERARRNRDGAEREPRFPASSGRPLQPASHARRSAARRPGHARP